MDNYRMNRGGYRTGMPASQQPHNTCRSSSGNGSMQPANCMHKTGSSEMSRHLDAHRPPAMGYVPFTKWGETFDLCKAFQVGTIFPELCLPFCGKGGGVCK